jgi:hypothetical protein
MPQGLIMKFYVAPLLTITACLSLCAHADESFETCSSTKVRQMELQRSIKAELNRGQSTAPDDRYRYRPDTTAMQQEEQKLEEWLWKSCRDYSNELRNIEQQYM